jgi:thiol-disulfide isomerase/thioredoxin
MKQWYWVIGLALAALSFNAVAQAPAKPTVPYSIKGHIEGLADTAIYIANYYGNKLYYNDTAQVDNKGNFQFKGKPYNECGKFALVLPGPKYFDFVVADENIVIHCTADADFNKIVIKESKNNQVFFDYIRFINQKRKDREPVDKCLSDSLKSDADKEPCKALLTKLNDEVIAEQKRLIDKYPDLLAVKLIRMALDPQAPAAPEGLSEEEKLRWQYYWFREHYWDNCDLKDPRLVREQQFHRLVEVYLTKTLPQLPDTMCTEVKKLIDRTAGNEDSFKYITHMATYTAETSKVMCMDRLFVYMVDNYYSKGLCSWMKEDKLAEMKKSANDKRNCLCGEVAKDIILPDTSGQKWVSMKRGKGKYTLLVIWESSCGHCKKEVPKLHELYTKYKDKGLVAYAIGNELENDKWIKFIDEKGLDWINVSDTPEIMKQDSATKLVMAGITTIESLNYRTTWDVNSTPKVFLMDKDMKIIAKQLSAEQLDDLLGRLESGEEVKLENMKEAEYEDEDAPAGRSPMKPRTPSPPKK